MNFYIKYWFYIASLFLVLTESADEPSCVNTINYVRQHESDLLYTHDPDTSSICSIYASNCCRSKVEKRLMTRTHQNMTNHIFKINTKMVREFNDYDNLLDAYEYIIETSKQEFSTYFYNTFGLHFYKHTQPADILFEYFKDFTTGQKNIDLLPAELHEFFANQFLASAKEFLYSGDMSPSYQQCIRSVYRRYEKLADYHEVYLSLYNTLTQLSIVVRARESLHRIVNHIHTDSLLLTRDQCPAALTRMSACQLCDGYQSLSPCKNFCHNTVSGCLAPLLRLYNPLLYQYRMLKQLTDKFERDFDELGQQLGVLTRSTMEFILRLHANSRKIVGQIKNKCAEDITTSRARRSDDKRSPYTIRYTPPPSNTIYLKSAVSQFLLSYEKVLSFLHTLPDKTCHAVGVARGNSECWNGKDKGKYTLGLVGTSSSEQLENPDISLTPNSFITYQADYEAVKQVTYSLQEFVQLKACHSDDVICISNLPPCSRTDSVTETSGLMELSGDGDMYIEGEGEAGGADTSYDDIGTDDELDYSGDGSYVEDRYMIDNPYYRIAKKMSNTVTTCRPSGFDLSTLTTTHYTQTYSTPETTVWDFGTNDVIQNSAHKYTSLFSLVFVMVVYVLTYVNYR